MSAFVIPDGPLRPHQIICANRMTQGKPLEPDGIQISRKGQGLDSEFNHMGKEPINHAKYYNRASIKI